MSFITNRIQGKTYFFVLMLLLGCQQTQQTQNPRPQTVVTTEATTPVTTLVTQPLPKTQIELISPTQTTSTTTIVQKTLTELNAQKTSEGILINLPENILFDFDKSDIRATAKPTLEKLNLVLRNYNNAPVSIYGHTDNKGNDNYNQNLSEQRATSVKAYLVKNFQLNRDRFETKGFGEKQPIAENANSDGTDNPNGRQKNRRVEVLIRNLQS